MAQNDAFRLCLLAALAALACGCVSLSEPAAIPDDQVLAAPQPAPQDNVAMAEEFHAAGIGADSLRGHLTEGLRGYQIGE